MTEKNKSQLINDISSNFPDNTSGLITPIVLREHFINEVDSFALETQLVDISGSLQTQIDSISGGGFTPLEGTGIHVTPSGNDYVFSVDDYISATSVANISGSLQTQIDNVSVTPSGNLTSATYDTENKLTSYVINGVNYNVTYNTLTTVIVGGGETRTLTYNASGLLVSDITV